MFKKFPILFGIVFFITIGCANPAGNLSMVYNPIHGIESGFWPMLLLVEMNTNFSSLIYDKTEARFETFAVRAFQMLPDNSKYYIMPVIYMDAHNNKRYDYTFSRIIGSYLKFNGYGVAVSSLEDADYVIVVDVVESPELNFGKNTSSIGLTIMDIDETPVFFVSTIVSSRSDRNFYYRPSRWARPVKYLTLKGFERIFVEALPQAFSS
jgi:hypothetical protein